MTPAPPEGDLREENLTTEDERGTRSGQLPAARDPKPDEYRAEHGLKKEPWDQKKAEEDTRRWLALGLLALLCATVMVVLALTAIKRLTQIEAALMVSPVVTLTGTALGFYFARR